MASSLKVGTGGQREQAMIFESKAHRMRQLSIVASQKGGAGSLFPVLLGAHSSWIRVWV